MSEKIEDLKEKYNFLLKRIKELRKTLTVRQIEIEYDLPGKHVSSFLQSKFSSHGKFTNKLHILFDKFY